MDKLKKEIKGIKNKLNHVEHVLVKCYTDVKDVERTQEYIENRLPVNENLEERMTRLEKYMDTIYKHLNETIIRINVIHSYLKEQEDLQCDEIFEQEEKTITL